MTPLRCLGIDWGERRWGLAFGDELAIALPLPALTEKDEAARWTSLAKLATQRRVTDFVVGYPLNMDGTAGFKAKEVDAFCARLKELYGLPIHLIDERLTSYEAESEIPPAKRRGLRGQGVVDSRAAAILLQDFLSSRFPLL
jgi:putative Holliday junction resolvase